MRSTVLYIILGVTLVALIALTILYFIKRKKAKAAEDSGEEVVGPGGDEISVLIHEAERKLAAAKLPAGAKVGNLPVYLLMGDPGSTKTSVMLHSGLEPELVSGQVYQSGNVTPTRTANLWFSRSSLFVELAGSLIGGGPKWKAAIKRLQPRSAVVGKGEQAPRAAVVCFDCENFTRPGAADIVTNAARTLRARLGEISQAMGINLPVYAIFTRTDRLPFFTEFVRNLNNDETTQVLGVTLPMINRRSEGVYAEEETARLSGNFERLFRALADARPEFLVREGDATKLPPAYEFPREFRKIRPSLVQFLVDLCRPSQLTVGPFLRGFYFTGVRPVIINETAPVAPAAPQQQGFGGQAGATGIFSAHAAAPAQGQPAAAPQIVGTRKVPQWLFLSHLFNDIFLADKAAMGASGASTKVSKARRILYAAGAAVCLLLCVFFTVSFFKNHALESRVHDAAQGLAFVEPTGNDLASIDSLRKLETLRQSLETLVGYRHDGAPWSYRWFLYVGDDVYPEARRIYFDRFRRVMFGQTQTSILQYLRGLPVTPGPEYSPTYDALKAYLMTTSFHEKSTRLFLTPVLMKWWLNNRTIDPDRQQLAQKQFDYYAEELKEENPYSRENDTFAIEKSRAYLKQFAGTERVYAFMIAEANKANPSVNFNRQFPGSAQTVVDTHDVMGAFTKGGWAFMKDAIAHADRYFNGEEWVLGAQGTGTIDRGKLEGDIKSRYYSDFVKEWRLYVKSAFVVRYAGLKDASQKLTQLSGNQSPLLELFALASQHTAVDDSTVSSIFQPVQTVVPPGNLDRFVGATNQNYMSALVQLQTSIEGVANQQPINDAAAAQTLQVATQAKVTTRQMAQAFRIDSEGHIEANVQKLLEDPIVYAEGLLRTLGPAELNAKGKALCGQLHPALAKYPFTPNSPVEATLQDIDAILKPKEGALWQFVDANLQKVVMKQGSQYVANPTAGMTILPSFLNFLNRAAAFSDTAFAGGSADPHFNYTIKPEFSPEMQNVTLNIDGQSGAFTAATPAKQFTWPGSAHGALMKVVFQGGKDFDYPNYDGLWAVFRFVADADSHTGSLIAMTLRAGKSGRPVLNPATNQPVTVRLDINANPPIFNPGYFTLACVPDIAK